MAEPELIYEHLKFIHEACRAQIDKMSTKLDRILLVLTLEVTIVSILAPSIAKEWHRIWTLGIFEVVTFLVVATIAFTVFFLASFSGLFHVFSAMKNEIISIPSPTDVEYVAVAKSYAILQKDIALIPGHDDPTVVNIVNYNLPTQWELVAVFTKGIQSSITNRIELITRLNKRFRKIQSSLRVGTIALAIFLASTILIITFGV